MLKSFRDTWLRDFFVDEKFSKKIPGTLRDRLFRKLQILDDATSDIDLRSPPCNHYEKLAGSLQGKMSILVNKQWRLIFVWDNEHGEASDVYLDNHTHTDKVRA